MLRDGLHERCPHFVDGNHLGSDDAPRRPGYVMCAKGLLGVDREHPWPLGRGGERPRLASSRGHGGGWWLREDIARCDSRGAPCPYKPVAELGDNELVDGGARSPDPDERRYVQKMQARAKRARAAAARDAEALAMMAAEDGGDGEERAA